MTQTTALIAAAAVLSLLLWGCRTPPPVPAATDAAAAARAELKKLVAEREAPGVQYLFLDAQGTVFSAEAGRADVASGSEVTPATLFHGYSVTKTFTAAAVLKLAAEGKLSLEDPISKHLPELGAGKAPTLRQVLSHTGGYANPIPMAWAHLARDDATFDQAAFVKKMIAAHGKVEKDPGAAFAYTNIGYLFLGEVIARVSGRPYTRYVEDELIAPLKLAQGEVLRFSMRDPAEHARGYIARYSGLNASLGLFIDREKFTAGSADGWTQFKDMQVDGPAYGGLLGNAAGFARYLKALLNAEAPFTPELVDQLLTQQKTAKGEAIPMALSWFKGELNGETYFDHAGGGGGYYCEIRVYPRARRASVAMFNRTGIKNDHLLDRLDPYFLPKGEAELRVSR